MNTQVTSIALFKTVIPASEPISVGRDFLGWLACLRACVSNIARQLSIPLIIPVEWVLCQSLANKIEVPALLSDVAVNKVLGWRTESPRRHSDARRGAGVV